MHLKVAKLSYIIRGDFFNCQISCSIGMLIIYSIYDIKIKYFLQERNDCCSRTCEYGDWSRKLYLLKGLNIMLFICFIKGTNMMFLQNMTKKDIKLTKG